MNKYAIRINAPFCANPVRFMFFNFGELTCEEVKKILMSVRFKEDYNITVNPCTHPLRKAYKDAYRVDDLETLISLVKAVRLTRYENKLVKKTVKHWIDTVAVTRFLPPFVCETVEFQGTNYTFINKTMTGGDEDRMIARILAEHGYSVGISKYNNPFVRGHRIEVERVDHPLFRKGVWEIYDVYYHEEYEYVEKIDE